MTAAPAANVYWDTNYTAPDSGNTGGNWQGGNWTATQDGTGVPGPWIDGSSAIFSAGTDGTGNWAVDLGGTINVASIKFAQSGSKTINAGGTIVIGGGSIDSTALGFAPGNGDDITINTILAGSGGLTIAAHGDHLSNNGGGGGAELRLNGDNTFSGGLTITSGLVSWTKDSALGDAANVITLNGGGLLYNGGGTITSPRLIKIGAQGGTVRQYGGQDIVFTQPLTNADGVASTIVRRTDGGTLFLPAGGASFSGTFHNGAGSTQLNSVNADWSKTDFVIDGGNLVANGTGTTVVKSLNSTADLIIDRGTTVNVATGAITMRGAHWYKTNNGPVGKLTSSSGTLTVTNGAATGDLGTTDHQFHVQITNSGATPVKLVKNNVNTLLLAQPSSYTGGTSINAGRLEARNNQAFGTGTVTVANGAQAFLSAAGEYVSNFTLNGNGITEGGATLGALRLQGDPIITGTVNLASASRITTQDATHRGTIAGLLTGSAALEKTGVGTLSITGNGSGYTGPITVAAGGLRVGSSLGASVLVQNGASLRGEGTIAGGVTIGSGTQSNLYVDGGTAGALSTTNLTVDGIANIRLTAMPAVPGSPIQVIKYSGSLTMDGSVNDAFQLENSGSYRGTPVFANTGNAITLSVPAGANLTWVGNDEFEPQAWDFNFTDNWKSATTNPEAYFNGDNVLFDDSGVTKNVVMSGLLSPATVTFNNSVGNDYVIAPNGGGFGFTGATSVVKNGGGTVTIQGWGHDYTGTVTINAGILQPNGNNEILGNASKVTINDGGQLNLNGNNTGGGGRSFDFFVAGDGPDGTGVINNTSANTVYEQAGILNLTMMADSAFGSVGRYDIGRSGGISGSIIGNGFTFTKVGSGAITLRGPATNINYVVESGTLRFENFDQASGTNPIQVNNGALDGYGDRTFPNVINLAAGTALGNDGGGTQTWTGPINLTGNLGDTVRISPRGGAIQIPGVISGNSNIEITNNNILYLTGTSSNTYVGDTTLLNEGQLVLNKTGGAIAITGDLTLSAGGTRAIVSTISDNQLAAGQLFRFAGDGDSRIELKGTTQTVGGLDYPVEMVGFKAIQHSEFGAPQPVDAVSDLILDVEDGFQYEYRGALRDTGGKVNLTKKGLGTQFLGGGLIDYSGPTVITKGRVILDSDDFHSASLAIAAGAVWEVQVSSATDTLQNDAEGFTLSGAGTYQKTGAGVNSIGWSGGASVAMSPGGLIEILEGRIRLEYGDLVSWTDNKGDLFVQGGAVFDLWDSAVNVIVNSLDGEGLITRENHNVAGSLTVGVANGSGEFNGSIADGTGKTSLVKAGTGTQKLSGINTYTGNTTVEGGTLHLTEIGSLRFALTSSGSTQINGTGTVILDGQFDIDSSALPVASGTWTLVDTASLTTTFGTYFSPGFDWTEDTPGNWSYENGETTGTFSEATGVLTLDSGATYASWIDGFFPGETDEDIIGANADPDGDGISNAVELMIGGNPASGMDTNLLPTLALVKDPAGVPVGEYFQFTYRRSGLAVAAGLTAASQYDADLVAPWTTAQNGVDGVVVLVDEDYASFEPAATDTDRVRVYIPRGTNPKLFGRLAVTVPGVPDAL